jgi:hypothetical protein
VVAPDYRDGTELVSNRIAIPPWDGSRALLQMVSLLPRLRLTMSTLNTSAFKRKA